MGCMDSGISRATAATVLNSLKGGVVPRTGLEYITVGRKNEIQALLQDVSIIEQGGAAVRFIEGEIRKRQNLSHARIA